MNDQVTNADGTDHPRHDVAKALYAALLPIVQAHLKVGQMTKFGIVFDGMIDVDGGIVLDHAELQLLPNAPVMNRAQRRAAGQR